MKKNKGITFICIFLIGICISCSIYICYTLLIKNQKEDLPIQNKEEEKETQKEITKEKETKKNNMTTEKPILNEDFYSKIKVIEDNRNIIVLVNKNNKLPDDFVPDLVEMEKKYTSKNAYMHPVAYNAFKFMVDDAYKENIVLRNVSSYRSIDDQRSIYNNYVNTDGVQEADTYSARAGHSEHNTGLATDINTASSSAKFQNTKEYAWLVNNSYKYGFILRYPENKTNITGYIYEPWHYRYIGIDIATTIHEEDITLEEYYETYISQNN